MTPLRVGLLLAIAACGSKDPADSTSPASGVGATGTSSLSATAEPAPETDAVWLVRWTSPAAGVSWVEFGEGGALDRSTAPDAGGTDHDHALIGLRPDTDHDWRAVTELPDGTRLSSPVETLRTHAPPEGMPLPQLQVSEAGSVVAGRHVLFSEITNTGRTWALVVDGEGTPVWWRAGAPGTMIVTTRPARNGSDLLIAEWDLAQQDDVATLWRVGVDGRAASATELTLGHHDFHEWPDGTLGYFGFETDPVALVASDAVFEMPEGGAGPERRVWSWLDDYPVDPWNICNHTAEGWPRDPQYDEWTHSNSLMVDATGEHYFVMSKFHDALLKIRRSDGALIWQLNGRYGDFSMTDATAPWTAVGDTQLWSHGHMSHLYEAPAGSGFDRCAAIFDNGLHYTPERSRAIEVCFDEAGLVAERTWTYPEPQGGVTAVMGDVRKLDGTWLIAWGSLSRIDEVTTAGDRVWRLSMPPGTSIGRVSVLDAFGG